MAVSTIQEVNIKLTLNRLVPGIEFHWRGDGDFGNAYDAIGDIRSQHTKPTEQALIDEYNVYLAEARATRATTETEVTRIVNDPSLALDKDQLDLSNETRVVQLLVEKIAYLEAELNALRLR